MQHLGKYIDLQAIGRGASATVYRATHRDLQSKRALKVFTPGSWQSQHRLDEALYQSRVEHPHIVQVIDIEHDAESSLLYMVMEYAPGGTLRKRLEQGPMDQGLALSLAAQMARALEAAHAKGVWHLDLKPENVLFFSDEQVKIADFGLAATDGLAAESEPVVGTPGYMAPEQFDRRRGPGADLWALGAILYEMLMGRAVFVDDDPAQLHRAMQRGPKDLDRLDAPLAELVGALLEYSTVDRPKSAGEVAMALETLLAHPSRADENVRPTIGVENHCERCKGRIPPGEQQCPDCRPASLSLPAPVRIAEQAPPPIARSRSRGLLGSALSVALGLAVAATLVWAWSPGGSPKVSEPTVKAAQAQSAPLPPVEVIKVSEAPATPAPRVKQTPPIKHPAATAPIVRISTAKAKPTPSPIRRTKVSAPKARAAAARPAARARHTPAVRRTPRRAASTPDRAFETAKSSGGSRRAVAAFRRHVDRNPNHLGARRNLALLYLERGDHQRAEAQLKSILRIKPRDVDAANLLELIRTMRAKGPG